MTSKKQLKISIPTRKAIYGLLFTLPFLIGFIVFFLSPFAFFVTLAFSKMTVTVQGMIVEFNGIENFKNLLISNKDFLTNIFDNIKSISYKVPFIILYSFFIAIILNQKFKGRFLARAIFFFPVIIASGSLAILNTDYLSMQAQAVVSGLDQNNTVVAGNSLYRTILMLFGQNSISNTLVQTVDTIISSADEIVNASGVQILIFLAGLQTVSPSLYEASRIDGASTWENFWKITLPILSPILLVNVAYTIIDCLAAADNWIIKAIYDKAAYLGEYTTSGAMGVIYFIIIFALLGTTMFFISKLVYYED